MKLAEALVQRADCQKRIEQLKERLMNNVKVQEGDEPSEPPAGLFKELDRLIMQLQDLIQAINFTNAITSFSSQGYAIVYKGQRNDNWTIADAIAARDILKLRQTIYRNAAEAASITRESHRYMRSEIKFHSTVDVVAIQAEADEIAKQYRELDSKIQQFNWQVELRSITERT